MTVVLDTPMEAGERIRVVTPSPDDFFRVDTGEWTAAGNTQKSAPNGVTLLSTTNVDNNLASLKRAYAWAQFRDDKPLQMMALVRYLEATVTGQTNIFIGLTSDTAANMLGNDGAGPAASFSGCGFLAVDGDAKLRCISSVGTARQMTILSATDRNNLQGVDVLASSANPRQFEIKVQQVGPGDFHVSFLIDRALHAQHRLLSTGAALMGECVAIKTGSANIQVLEVDLVATYAVR